MPAVSCLPVRVLVCLGESTKGLGLILLLEGQTFDQTANHTEGTVAAKPPRLQHQDWSKIYRFTWDKSAGMRAWGEFLVTLKTQWVAAHLNWTDLIWRANLSHNLNLGCLTCKLPLRGIKRHSNDYEKDSNKMCLSKGIFMSKYTLIYFSFRENYLIFGSHCRMRLQSCWHFYDNNL